MFRHYRFILRQLVNNTLPSCTSWSQYYYYYYYWYSALGPVSAEIRAQSGDWYSSGKQHPGKVLRGRLPLLSPPLFRRSHLSIVQYKIIKDARYVSLIHLAVCLTTRPKPLPKPALHIVRSRASSFK